MQKRGTLGSLVSNGVARVLSTSCLWSRESTLGHGQNFCVWLVHGEASLLRQSASLQEYRERSVPVCSSLLDEDPAMWPQLACWRFTPPTIPPDLVLLLFLCVICNAGIGIQKPAISLDGIRSWSKYGMIVFISCKWLNAIPCCT